MVPLTEGWYQKLLMGALGLGIVGGLIAVAYGAVSSWGIGGVFGDPSSDWWSGEWWWILLVAAGALVVAALRQRLDVPEDVPGAIAYARIAWVEPNSAASLVGISLVSLIAGASLGPSFGIVVAGGACGSWLVGRIRATTTKEAQQEYALTGMAGGLGAFFSAPLFASILSTELSPTSKNNYVEAFIPQFIAASIGFAIFFGVTDDTMLGAFSVSDVYEYENLHLLLGVVLGALSAVTLLVHASLGNLVRRAMATFTNPFGRAAVGGALIGLMAFALPLTATGGSSQLAYTTERFATLGIGILIATLIGKMIAMTLSQEVGFLGGTVFPILFIGGTAGVLVHTLFPSIPAPLAVAAMVAAVPGAIISAPASFTLIGAGGVALGEQAIAPIGIAVITAYLAVAAIKLFREQQGAM